MRMNERMKYAIFEEENDTQKLIDILDRVHNPDIAYIRGRFFQLENTYFQNYIRDANVVCFGSGLGHEVFELAGYNQTVLGVEINRGLHNEALRRMSNQYGHLRDKLIFGNYDMFVLDKKMDWFSSIAPYKDHAVLNMGTIGNFAQQEQIAIIKQMQIAGREVHFSFYKTSEEAVEQRIRMYTEEGWTNVHRNEQGDALVCDEGLFSRIQSLDDVHDVVLQADSTNVMEIYNLGQIGLMARVYREVTNEQ